MIVLNRRDLDLIVDALDVYADDRKRHALEWAQISNDCHEPVFDRARAVVSAAEAFDDAETAGELIDRIMPLIARRS